MQARRLLSQGLHSRNVRLQQRQVLQCCSNRTFSLPTNIALSTLSFPVSTTHPSSLLGSSRALSQRSDSRDSQRRKSKDEPNLPLANEKLVAQLMRQSPEATSADDVQVRLLVDVPGNTPPSNQVVSLAQAIQTSIEEQTDLIEIAIKQDIPVVRVTSLNALQYKMSRSKSNANKPVAPKEFRFNTGIAGHDLDRKIANVVKILEKGHNCLLMVRCKRWESSKHGPGFTTSTVQLIMSQLQEACEIVVPPKANPDHNIVRWSIRPSAQLKQRSS